MTHEYRPPMSAALAAKLGRQLALRLNQHESLPDPFVTRDQLIAEVTEQCGRYADVAVRAAVGQGEYIALSSDQLRAQATDIENNLDQHRPEQEGPA